MYKNIDIKYGVQTIFSTISSQKGSLFEKGIEDDFFKSYKIGTKNEGNILYDPIKYYIMGEYDVVYIALINNFKFSQRLFETKSGNGNDFSPHNFQSFSGFSLNDDSQLEKLFGNKIDDYFIGIINLKVNNGLLLGNGLKIVEAIHTLIKAKLLDSKIDYLFTQTLSWFEISLCIFIKDPKELSTILSYLRTLEYRDLDSLIKDESLYTSILKEEDRKKIKYASLFSDTHTYIGFNSRLISSGLYSEYVKEFRSDIKIKELKLKTQVEWQVKPGHILRLQNVLEKHKYLKGHFNFENKQIVLGKSDYMLQKIEGDNIEAIFHLIRYLKRKEGQEVYKHARKVRSYISLDAEHVDVNSDNHNTSPIVWNSILNNLEVHSDVFFKVDKALKALKVSRQLRIKILKIFSNYNNSVQDPILFTYFKDFKVFIDNIILLIFSEEKKMKESSFPLKDLELRLNKHIQAFQEGYNVRFLNSYQFENISDFDLDFNSSIQQLLACYGFLIYDYGKLFYKRGDYLPVIQLNDIDTISNHLTINYSVHHLTSPEFVFTTILKEILNNISIDSDDYKLFLKGFYDNVDDIKIYINESYFDDMYENNLVDLNYFIIDSIRFMLTFNCDFKLFAHWFWSYNFQNSSLFNSTGMFNESYLRIEMLRLFFIKKYFKIKIKIKCPSPELLNYWVRHEAKINKIAKKLVRRIKSLSVENSKKISINFDVLIKSIVEGHLVKFNGKYMNTDYVKVLNHLALFEDHAPFIDEIKVKKRLEFLFSTETKEDNIFAMEKLMYDTLFNQYEDCDNRVVILRRDWFNGDILKNHDFLYEKISYAIDQTGGVYFLNSEKTTKYFSSNAQCLLKIIDYSLRSRVKFIKEVIDGKD